MAGKTERGLFHEKLTPFLTQKLEYLRLHFGEDSEQYRAIALQYKKQDLEDAPESEANQRHWEADLAIDTEHRPPGIERLYMQSLVIEPTMICAAHCRYCLRAHYDIFTLGEDALTQIAQYCGSNSRKDELNEVLVTGGDPFVVPRKLLFLVEALIDHAPNIKTIRIGTRLPSQDPGRVDNNVYEIFRRHRARVRFELATQINHAVELFPEVIEVLHKIRELGVKLYSQNILLKHINDDISALINLYRKMRELDIEAHYLFHCVPMKGMHHFRTTVAKGLELVKHLTNSGRVSGRAKPMYALMTDVGKITLHHGTILGRNDSNQILLQSSYLYEERLRLNPCWELPRTAIIDPNGYLRVWYLDGKD